MVIDDKSNSNVNDQLYYGCASTNCFTLSADSNIKEFIFKKGERTMKIFDVVIVNLNNGEIVKEFRVSAKNRELAMLNLELGKELLQKIQNEEYSILMKEFISFNLKDY